jgi:hypothetical protein
MLVATCIFQISSETRTIEINDSIVRRYTSDTERDRESYTEVCDFAFHVPSFWTFNFQPRPRVVP